MTKYEDLIKQRKNKDIPVDEIAKKYKMSVMDVKIMQEWKEKYEKEHKLRQEAETETILVKGIGINSPEMRDSKKKIEELQANLERFGKENNELYNRIADLTESLQSKDYFKDPDYKYLVDENHRLEQQYLEVIADNKKLTKEIEDRIDRMRKSGM
jgi:predicted RNase H-like nuclease (RuvC/YqgF family)